MKKITFSTLLTLFLFSVQEAHAQDYKIDSLQTYEWNEGWQMKQRYHYAYDDNEILETLTILLKAAPGIWNNSSRQVFTLDGENRLMDIVSQYHNSFEWINSSRQHFDYDINGNNDVLTYYNFISDTWEVFGQDLKTYNGSNQISENIYQECAGGSCSNYSKTTYMYGAGELATDETGYIWGGSDWSTDPNYRILRTYDGSLLKEEKHQTYDMGWVDYLKFTVLYDGDKVDEFLYQEWDNIDMEWDNVSNGVYTYNGNNIDEVTTSTWSGSWDLQSKLKYYWSELALSTTNIKKNELKIFPNPTQDYVNISLEWPLEIDSELKLFDLQGKLLSNTPFVKGAQHVVFSIQHFQKGMYIIKISNSNFEKTFKIIKE